LVSGSGDINEWVRIDMISKFYRATVGLSAIIGMGLGLTACGDGEGQSARLLSGEKKPLTAEQEQIQKLLKVRVWDEAAGKWTDKTVGDLISLISGVTAYYRANWTTADGQEMSDSCIDIYSNNPADPGVYLSKAIALNKIARSLVPISVPHIGTTYLIPPQEHTTRVTTRHEPMPIGP
jgi:hypothetical protein